MLQNYYKYVNVYVTKIKLPCYNDCVDNENSTILKRIQDAKTGDKNSFELLYLELYQPLYKFVLFKTHDVEKTKDIVQDVFFRWYKSLDTYTPDIKPLNYLITIAMRLIINESKRKKAITLDEDIGEIIESQDQKIEEILNTNMEFEKVREIIEQELSQSEQDVIILKYVDDLDNKELAQMLEKSEGNIRVIEYRGLKKIKDIYHKKYGK